MVLNGSESEARSAIKGARARCAGRCVRVASNVWYGMVKEVARSVDAGESRQAASYGLRRGVLSPMETLAQSVSTIAPTATPVATIPLVCALAGNGTWLAYVLATSAVLLVALCVSKFARYS